MSEYSFEQEVYATFAQLEKEDEEDRDRENLDKVTEYRVFLGWDNGCYVNSLSSTFHEDLNQLIKEYGQPNCLAIRKSIDGEFVS